MYTYNNPFQTFNLSNYLLDHACNGTLRSRKSDEAKDLWIVLYSTEDN